MSLIRPLRIWPFLYVYRVPISSGGNKKARLTALAFLGCCIEKSKDAVCMKTQLQRFTAFSALRLENRFITLLNVAALKFAKVYQASMSFCGPKILITRFMLYARTWRLISVLTLGTVFVRNWV